MLIKINNSSIDFSAKNLDKIKISIVNGGRRLKGDGFKNVSLNDLINAVLRELKHPKPEDLVEAKDLLDRFTKIANIGYESDGKISKLPFFIRWISNVKHLYGEWRRKHLLKDLDKTITTHYKNLGTPSIKQSPQSQISNHDNQQLNDQQNAEKLKPDSENLSFVIPEEKTTNLPDDILAEIFIKADPKDISNLSQVNKQYSKITKGKTFKGAFEEKLFEIVIKFVEKSDLNINSIIELMDIDLKKAISLLNKNIDKLTNSGVYLILTNLNDTVEKDTPGLGELLEKLKTLCKKRNLSSERELATLYARMGNFQEAKALNGDPKAFSFEILLKSILDNPKDAEQIIGKATIDSLSEARFVHLQILHRSLESEKVSEILQLCQKRVGINSLLINAYLRFGYLELACNSFKKAMSEGDDSKKIELLRHLFIKKSDWIQLFSKDSMSPKNLEILDLVAGLEDLDIYHDSRDITQKINHYLYAAIEGYIIIGEFRKAEKILERLEPGLLEWNLHLDALESLALKKVQQKDHEDASRVLESAKKLFENRLDYHDKKIALIKLASVYAEFDTQKAKELLDPIELEARSRRPQEKEFLIRVAGVYRLIDLNKAKVLLREAETMMGLHFNETEFVMLARLWLKIDPQQVLRLFSSSLHKFRPVIKFYAKLLKYQNQADIN